MFSKVLVANRGEVALRIIRACREMGIRTVAVYSEADRESLPVQFADEAICIGAKEAASSYLHIPAIISAAEITDVEAIHPGYGFLAENAHFAEICQSCKIVFIGPTPENIRTMGNKMLAKETMRKVGLPVVPGSQKPVETKEEALSVVKRIKYPVIIKAVAGGGGRGMRIAHNDVSLVSSYLTCQSEAEAAFGNPQLYIEKYIENPRHIEFQVLGDRDGNVIQLGERDCTVQRRHQKLIEESPSPALNEDLRKKMAEVVVKGTREARYLNAGTIEFLLDKENKFYFMEMNTRIQVEHPVTEMLSGMDLVKEQICIAAGERLSLKQNNVKLKGAAIECRINAEDPDNNFLPSPGKIDTYHVPGGRGVRVDSHVYSGYEISPYYDSMIAKLITYGKDREEAIQIMQRSLDEYVIKPIKTTIPFHKKVLHNLNFLEGKISTHFAEELLGEKK